MAATAITPVILGLLAMRPLSGYDIQAVVDRSTRFFWAASYGQIYPRRVYSLTPAGRDALVEWLLGPTVTIELRGESLLRLFFADSLPKEQALMLLEWRKLGHQQYLETLRAIDARPGQDPQFVDLVLRWGIEFNEWGAQWCQQQLDRLKSKTKAA